MYRLGKQISGQLMARQVSDFVSEPLQRSLMSVPGIDAQARETLMNKRISNTHQLIGQFLLFHANDVDAQQLHERFKLWLGKLGVTRNSAVIASAVAEKVGKWIEGVCDGDAEAWDLCCDVGGCSSGDLKRRFGAVS